MKAGGRRRAAIRGGLVLAGIAGVVAVKRRASRRRVVAGDGSPASGGWATCSAPSARAYEATFGWLLRDLYRRMADDLAAAVAGIAEPAVLEVGPGPGGLAVELARRHPGLRLTGVDVDPAMVARARSRAARDGVADRVAFEVGDVAALPFPDGTFDLVASSFSAHHWPDGAAGFAEIRRVLRPGGRAIVFDLPDRWGRFETKAPPLADAATAGGFAAAPATAFRWPGRVALVRRLDIARDPDTPLRGGSPAT